MKIRLNKVQKELNIGLNTIVEFLQKKGFEIKEDPNAVVPEEGYNLLMEAFSADKSVRMQSEIFTKERQNKDKSKVSQNDTKPEEPEAPSHEPASVEKKVEPQKPEPTPAP